MARNLLQLVQAAANELGIPEPASLAGALDDQSKQLFALANREGKDFSQLANGDGGWQDLHKEYTFTTVQGQQAYNLPNDFEYFSQQTFWDGAYKWQLLGPISAQEKQILKYGIIASGPRRKFWIRLNQLWLDPIPGESGQVIAYDYFSNSWCTSSTGVDQTAWLADTDLYKLDEDCFIQGIKWRWLRSKGLDYTQEFADYERDTARVMGRDGGTRDFTLGGAAFAVRFLNNDNIQETGFGEPYNG